MRINDKLIVAFEHEGLEYTAMINPKRDEILLEDETWEVDVNCNKTLKGYGYPYLTIWGHVDKDGILTTEGLHGLLNYENYDVRICSEDLHIVHCS
jgi:hypothetical protein